MAYFLQEVIWHGREHHKGQAKTFHLGHQYQCRRLERLLLSDQGHAIRLRVNAPGQAGWVGKHQ